MQESEELAGTGSTRPPNCKPAGKDGCMTGDATKENIAILYDLNKINENTLECAKKYCKQSHMGEYKCSVKNRFGFFCDLCLEDELLFLRSQGVHTVASCCGHGNKSIASILTIGENSYHKMFCMNYEKAIPFFYGKNASGKSLYNWVPKSTLIYE